MYHFFQGTPADVLLPLWLMVFLYASKRKAAEEAKKREKELAEEGPGSS